MPSSTTRPLVGKSRPATMRSNVDLPHPDGPSTVMKSLSATLRLTGCSASVGGPPRTPGNVRPTPSMTSLLMETKGQPSTGMQEHRSTRRHEDTKKIKRRSKEDQKKMFARFCLSSLFFVLFVPSFQEVVLTFTRGSTETAAGAPP